jgi:hypothetical protein
MALILPMVVIDNRVVLHKMKERNNEYQITSYDDVVEQLVV